MSWGVHFCTDWLDANQGVGAMNFQDRYLVDFRHYFSLDCYDSELSQRMSKTEWQRVLKFRSNPRFLDALFAYDTLMPNHFANNMILNKVVTESRRFEMLVYALYLHDTHDPTLVETGLTFARLAQLCIKQNVASRGRIFAILGIMQIGGYLKRYRSEHDRRIVMFEPTQKFMVIVEGWNQLIFQIISTVCPEDKLAENHKLFPRLGTDMRTNGARLLINGWKLLDPFPEVEHFLDSDGGWMLLLTAVAASLRASDGKILEPISIDLQAFGKRFGVSRSHSRRLLESAYANGLLQKAPQNGRNILPSQKLAASFLTCMASELSNYQICALKNVDKKS